MTIKDIAAKTGYAVGTVSRALNNHPNVSEKARATIVQAAQEMENMINYEEELKKFRPSLDVNEAEDAIYNRDFTDVTDILKELINDEKKKNKGNL